MISSPFLSKTMVVAKRFESMTKNPSLHLSRQQQGANNLLFLLRGGAESAVVEAPLNVARVQMRLEGLQSYSVVSALLLNACLVLFVSTPKLPSYYYNNNNNNDTTTSVSNKKKKKKRELIPYLLFALSICTSVVSSSFTTIVFSLLSLYSKSALGLNRDQAFTQFFLATSSVRSLAFYSFLISLVGFQSSFVLSLYLHYNVRQYNNNNNNNNNQNNNPDSNNNPLPQNLHWCISFGTALLALASIWHWSTIVDMAGRYIFVAK